MKWSNTYADMCLRCPCCSRKSTYEPLEGNKDGLNFALTTSSLMLHCWLVLCFNDRVPVELRDEHNVACINISLAWWRKRKEKMERSAAWPQLAMLTLSLITVAPRKEERQMRTVCSEWQPGHPVNTQHHRRGLRDRCPLGFVVNSLMSLPAGDCWFRQLFSLWASGPPLAWVSGHGNRLQAVSPLLVSSGSCSGNLLCHNHLLVNLVWWMSDWRKNWLSPRMEEWVADVRWGIPMESFWTLFGSQDRVFFRVGGGSHKSTPKISCNIQNNFRGFWSLGKNTRVWKACETKLEFWLVFVNVPKTFFKWKKLNKYLMLWGVFRHSVQFLKSTLREFA